METFGISFESVERKLDISVYDLLESSEAIVRLTQAKEVVAQWAFIYKGLDIGKARESLPDAIGLLVNLETLHLKLDKMKAPPNLSHNVNLKSLCMDTSLIKVYGVPKAHGSGNKVLTTAPDLSKNIRLEKLVIKGMDKLATPPDVSTLIHLEELNLSGNALTTPPDISKNRHLLILNVAHNQLEIPPNTKENLALRSLYLDGNKLITLPDLSQNKELYRLSALMNKITDLPDLNKNPKLKRIGIDGNPLIPQFRESLKEWVDDSTDRCYIF